MAKVLARKHKRRPRLYRGMQRKLWMAFFIVCILFVALIGRIMYIQYTSGTKYEKQVLSQMSFQSQTIPFKRGDITDTNGTVLATSIDVYTLVLDAVLLNENEKAIDSTIKYVCRYFPEVSEQTIRDVLRDNPDNRYYPLLKEISYEAMMAFTEIMNDKETKKEISGVWFEKNYRRAYPYGQLASDVIGFATTEGGGVIGLENAYNKELSGTNGRSYGYLDEDYNRQRRTENAINGNTLVTTIDINIQSILEQEIAAFNKKMSSDTADGSLHTSALVMDPRNGEVLAMADYPTFDLNDPWDLSGAFSEEELSNMSADEKLDELNTLWQNFCITNTFEPGSTFKPFTIACGLETGTLTGNEVFNCDGAEHIDDWTIKCVNVYGHGQLTVEQSLMESCNDALMQMSYRIGAHNFATFQKLFGFGQRTNIDITGEARTDSVMFSEKELESRVNLATNSFGQNFNVTMIQLASAFSSLINGGTLYEPHIVKSVVDPTGGVSLQKSAVEQKDTVSKETCEQMRGYLKSVVSGGTGKTAGVAGYSIGGKTGTAEKLPRGNRKYLVSFIGFAPVEDPQVLVYVVVDEPNTADQAHSSFAQEIVHNVFEQILPYLNIDIDETGEIAEPITSDYVEQIIPEGENVEETAETTETTESTESTGQTGE